MKSFGFGSRNCKGLHSSVFCCSRMFLQRGKKKESNVNNFLYNFFINVIASFRCALFNCNSHLETLPKPMDVDMSMYGQDPTSGYDGVSRPM